jgi:hypothetical protein
MFNVLPIELNNIIFDHLDFMEKIRLKNTNKYLYNIIKITNLCDIDQHLLNKLDDNILKNYAHSVILK